MRGAGLVAGWVLTVGLAGGSLAQTAGVNPAAASNVTPGSEACSSCHSEIYKSYAKTVMAGASGVAGEGLITGEFKHKASGVLYRVYEKRDAGSAGGASAVVPIDSGQSGSEKKEDAGCARGTDECVRSHATTVWMSYEREKENDFHGERELLYFIGSGVKGRSYLFSAQGFLFETPINWYTQEHRWNMTPAYTEAREIPMNLPSFVDCLNCHTSGMQAPVAGTDSKFSGKPFLHGGITCERCHGVGAGHGAEPAADAGCARGTDECVRSHVSEGSQTSQIPHASQVSQIVNPAKLPPERRDAICMECHFEGTVAVEQPGKHLYQFQPGEKLSDYSHYFLLTGGSLQSGQGTSQPEKTEALSQVEALSLSMCKRKSGDKMWCGSCHDPHSEPAPAEKAAFYRGKCLACHGEGFGAKHHRDKPDCTQCHMPALPNQAVAHTQSTDHRIMKYPNGFQFPAVVAEARLTAFPESAAGLVTTRDLALAWETLAQRGIEGASHQAEQYLRKAAKERPEDARVLAALGFVEQQHGRDEEARELYERALKIDPLANDAATNLGTLEARAGNLKRAVELWQAAFERVPHRSAIGMDLAMAFCAAGQKDEARRYVTRVLEFNPDFGNAKRLLGRLDGDPVRCRP